MKLKNESGEDTIADAIAYIRDSIEVKIKDKIVYTDSNSDEKRFEVLEVYEAQGAGKLHHKNLLLHYAIV